MKWSKGPKSLTEKGEFGPHSLPIFGRSPKETLGASWHWQIGINPRQVSVISCMRSLWNRRAGLLTCFTQGMPFMDPPRRPQGSPASSSVWREDPGLLSRPCITGTQCLLRELTRNGQSVWTELSFLSQTFWSL